MKELTERCQTCGRLMLNELTKPVYFCINSACEQYLQTNAEGERLKEREK